MGQRAVVAFSQPAKGAFGNDFIFVTTVQWATVSNYTIPLAIRSLAVDSIKGSPFDTNEDTIDMSKEFQKAATTVFSSITDYCHIGSVKSITIDDFTTYMNRPYEKNLFLALGEILNKDSGQKQVAASIINNFDDFNGTSEKVNHSETIRDVVKKHEHQQDGIGAYYTEGDDAVHFYIDPDYICAGEAFGSKWRESYSAADCLEEIKEEGLVNDSVVERVGFNG